MRRENVILRRTGEPQGREPEREGGGSAGEGAGDEDFDGGEGRHRLSCVGTLKSLHEETDGIFNWGRAEETRREAFWTTTPRRGSRGWSRMLRWLPPIGIGLGFAAVLTCRSEPEIERTQLRL